MSTRIQLVKNDTRPTIVVAMVDRDTWSPIDVSNASTNATMKFRAAGSTTVLQTITAAKLPYQLLSDGTLDLSVSTPGAGGRVSFAWPPSALNVTPGYYEGEVSISFNDGTLQTIYDLLRFNIRDRF